jgi:hypothetical protein
MHGAVKVAPSIGTQDVAWRRRAQVGGGAGQQAQTWRLVNENNITPLLWLHTSNACSEGSILATRTNTVISSHGRTSSSLCRPLHPLQPPTTADSCRPDQTVRVRGGPATAFCATRSFLVSSTIKRYTCDAAHAVGRENVHRTHPGRRVSVGLEPVACTWGRSWAHKCGASMLTCEVDLGKM